VKEIYLDNAATTAVRQEVVSAMLPYFMDIYGNPSSLHSVGQKGKKALEEARDLIASTLTAEPHEIYFTSGATESNNLAIKGVACANKEGGRHLITSSIEHHAALNVFKLLEKEGFEITYLPVDKFGLIDPDQVEEAVRSDTILISIMLANNEIGTIEPVKEVAAIAREHGVIMHSDAVQAIGKIPVSVRDLGVDLLSLTAHKIYGPKGTGALFIRKDLKICSLFEGGHQEKAVRPGTQNIAGVVGLAKALTLASAELDSEPARIASLRDRLEKEVIARVGKVTLNGHPVKRVPNIASLNFAHLEGEALLLALDTRGIAVSTSSACTTGSDEPSHVLSATGLDPLSAKGTLRFSLGRNNSAEEVDYVIETVVDAVEQLRRFSPLTE
jgi:cysteine desulfurase